MDKVRKFNPTELARKYNERGTSWHEFVNEEVGAPFASGVTYLQDSDFEWTLWYDEIMICIDPGELLEVATGGRTYSLRSGESLWLPKGTVARYRSVGTALMSYVISPADWRKNPVYSKAQQLS